MDRTGPATPGAGWDPVPSDAAAHPAGPAIAAFLTGREDGAPFQLLVGAHGPVARRGSGTLSPDGRWLATVGPGVELVDLTTGEHEALHGLRTAPGDVVAAWSHDANLGGVRAG